MMASPFYFSVSGGPGPVDSKAGSARMPSPGRPLADLAPRQPQYSDGFRISKAKKQAAAQLNWCLSLDEAFHIAGIGGILVGCSFSSIMLRPSASLMVWFL
jgi:hypothetical protein